MLKSESKVRKFLDNHGISYDVATSPEVLRGKAKARMKRLAEEGLDDTEKRALFKSGQTNSLSIVALKKMMSEMETNGKNVERFCDIAFTIQDLSAVSNFTVRKHGNGPGACKGKIIDGQCYVCGEVTEGAHFYSFKAVLGDLADDDATVSVTCAEGAGKSLFKKEAFQFAELSTAAIKDAVESIMFVPKKSGCWIKYEAGKGDRPSYRFNMSPDRIEVPPPTRRARLM